MLPKISPISFNSHFHSQHYHRVSRDNTRRPLLFSGGHNGSGGFWPWQKQDPQSTPDEFVGDQLHTAATQADEAARRQADSLREYELRKYQQIQQRKIVRQSLMETPFSSSIPNGPSQFDVLLYLAHLACNEWTDNANFPGSHLDTTKRTRNLYLDDTLLSATFPKSLTQAMVETFVKTQLLKAAYSPNHLYLLKGSYELTDFAWMMIQDYLQSINSEEFSHRYPDTTYESYDEYALRDLFEAILFLREYAGKPFVTPDQEHQATDRLDWFNTHVQSALPAVNDLAQSYRAQEWKALLEKNYNPKTRDSKTITGQEVIQWVGALSDAKRFIQESGAGREIATKAYWDAPQAAEVYQHSDRHVRISFNAIVQWQHLSKEHQQQGLEAALNALQEAGFIDGFSANLSPKDKALAPIALTPLGLRFFAV